MSAPNLDDPDSRLKLRLRSMPGRVGFLALGRALGLVGAVACVVMGLLGLVPGVVSSVGLLWPLVGAVLFGVVAGAFHAALGMARRMR
jgi:hypothetical protein